MHLFSNRSSLALHQSAWLQVGSFISILQSIFYHFTQFPIQLGPLYLFLQLFGFSRSYLLIHEEVS